MTNFSDMLSKAKAMQDKMKEAQDQIKKIIKKIIFTVSLYLLRYSPPHIIKRLYKRLHKWNVVPCKYPIYRQI